MQADTYSQTIDNLRAAVTNPADPQIAPRPETVCYNKAMRKEPAYAAHL